MKRHPWTTPARVDPVVRADRCAIRL